MVQRILQASDFPPASRSAFTLARVLARKLGARLISFHAYERIALVVMATPMMPLAGPGSGSIVDHLWAAARTAGERGLERLAARARRDGLRRVSPIGQAARKERAAMVVLGTHGRTGLPRLLLGLRRSRRAAPAQCRAGRAPTRRDGAGALLANSVCRAASQIATTAGCLSLLSTEIA